VEADSEKAAQTEDSSNIQFSALEALKTTLTPNQTKQKASALVFVSIWSLSLGREPQRALPSSSSAPWAAAGGF
jgi:hypothetical protein